MVCVCSPEGKQDAIEMRIRAAATFDVDDYTTMEDWATQMVHALNQTKGSWGVDYVGADMWLGVGISAYRPQTPNNDNGGESYFIQCDRLEDGLTALYLHVYDLYGDDDD